MVHKVVYTSYWKLTTPPGGALFHQKNQCFILVTLSKFQIDPPFDFKSWNENYKRSPGQRSGDTSDCRLAVTTATTMLKTTPSDAEKINLSKDTR